MIILTYEEVMTVSNFYLHNGEDMSTIQMKAIEQNSDSGLQTISHTSHFCLTQRALSLAFLR